MSAVAERNGMKYSIGIDPWSGGAVVLEQSLDFEGWIVLFHCGSLHEAHAKKRELEQIREAWKRHETV